MKKVFIVPALLSILLPYFFLSAGTRAVEAKDLTDEMVKEALAHEKHANELCDNGKLEKCIAEYEASLEINPYSTSALFNLGLAYLKAHRVKEAVYTYERAKDLAPKDAEIHKLLGISYIYGGRKEEAISEWQKSLELNPNQPRVREFIEANK